MRSKKIEEDIGYFKINIGCQLFSKEASSPQWNLSIHNEVFIVVLKFMSKLYKLV